jgi:hypothetical protein
VLKATKPKAVKESAIVTQATDHKKKATSKWKENLLNRRERGSTSEELTIHEIKKGLKWSSLWYLAAALEPLKIVELKLP